MNTSSTLTQRQLFDFRARERPREWTAACDIFVARFLRDLRLVPLGPVFRIA